MPGYRDLIVWQKAMELVERVYQLTKSFPVSERYGLTSQMRRAAVSIPSNIAEGKLRGTRKDYRHFLINSYSSGAELETQLEISRRLAYSDKEKYLIMKLLLDEIMRMLNKMIASLNT